MVEFGVDGDVPGALPGIPDPGIVLDPAPEPGEVVFGMVDRFVRRDGVAGVDCDGVGAAPPGAGCSGIVPGVVGAVPGVVGMDPGAGIAPGEPGVTGEPGISGDAGLPGVTGVEGVVLLGDPGVAGEGVVLCAAAVPAIRHMEKTIGKPGFMVCYLTRNTMPGCFLQETCTLTRRNAVQRHSIRASGSRHPHHGSESVL